MIALSRKRSLALTAGGSILLALALTSCGAGDSKEQARPDETAYFGTLKEGGSTGFSGAKASQMDEAVANGLLPKSLPTTATEIAGATANDLVYASWKGPQARLDGCAASPDTVPAFPETVRQKGVAKDAVDCGDVHQATVGAYTYYWGAVQAPAS